MIRCPRFPRIALAVCLTLGAAECGRANEIYDKLAPSTVIFLDYIPGGGATVAAGVLVDADKRLVLTAEHVVHRVIRDGSLKTSVMFPVFDKNGKIETNASHYSRKRAALSISGDVVYYDRTKDIAIVQLTRVPDGVKGIPLSAVGVEPGDPVHLVGNSTFFDGGSFDYCAGTVRNNFYMNKTSVTPANNPVRDLIYYTMTNDIPSNPGDSGGPTVNSKGELVAIVSRGTPDPTNHVQVVDNSIHLRELRRALDLVQQPSGNALQVEASVDQLGFDCFFVPVTAKGNLSATLSGKGTTDLDLYVKDIDQIGLNWQSAGATQKLPDYTWIMSSTGLTDSEKVSGSINWTGIALVQVQNIGSKTGNRNQYVLSLNWEHPTKAPFTFIRKLAANGTDTIKLPYQAGKGKARVGIRGDGAGLLVMEVFDPQGNPIAQTAELKGTGYRDIPSLVWEPATSGVYTIRIANSQNDWSEYVFTTD
jgi:Trypsin-like peptidase domain